MKLISILFSVLLLLSCENKLPENQYNQVNFQANDVALVNSDDDITDLIEEEIVTDDLFNEFPDLATYYIVCLDSGKNYYSLDSKMYRLKNKYKLEIDTADRSYDSKKDLIALPLDAEDEMYAGDYYPRRYPSVHLSLEYMYIYDENINSKTIGLIAGIFEDKQQADSLLFTFGPNENSFILKGKVYVGCMH